VLLPAGSAPGTWGLADMTIYDRAGNLKRHDFTEIVHFDGENLNVPVGHAAGKRHS